MAFDASAASHSASTFCECSAHISSMLGHCVINIFSLSAA